MGIIGDKAVTFLRDSRCSGVVVRQDLVSPDWFTGQDSVCVLIDGTMKKAPVANVAVNAPFFVDQTKALCMQNTLYNVNREHLRSESTWRSGSPVAVSTDESSDQDRWAM